VGDEPLLIHQATQAPVFVAQQRLQAGRALRAAHPEVNVIVADDGLQHWALHRDVNVVVFDDRGLGNGWLLPAGLLREPWPPRPPHLSQALVLRHSNPAQPNRARVPVLSGMADFTLSRTLSPQAINACGQTRHWADWGHTPVNAVAGVARPEVFFEMLRQGGLSALRPHALPDHAQASDYDAVCADHAHDCLCTDKDAVKLFDRSDIDPARVWRVPLTLSHETDWLDAVIARLPTRL
jgi:tetraacyldisaccharide 4'-kinase